MKKPLYYCKQTKNDYWGYIAYNINLSQTVVNSVLLLNGFHYSFANHSSIQYCK